MKNKKYIWISCFVLSTLLLTYSYKDLSRYYYVKMGNKNYYSKNYEKAVEYYEKALKIKEDYNIRINLIITDYQMKNYKKVLENPVENGFLKGNSLVLISEKNPNNQKDLEQSLKYYREEILKDSDINIKKNYEIVEKKLKEQQNQDNNQQDNSPNKQNNNNNLDNQKQNDNKSNQDQNNSDKQNPNNNQQDLDKNQSKNNSNQQQNNNSNDDKKLNNQNSSYGQTQNIEPQNHQQKELQIMLKNLEKNEKQSFKNNERLIGVENKSETKNRW